MDELLKQWEELCQQSPRMATDMIPLLANIAKREKHAQEMKNLSKQINEQMAKFSVRNH